MLDHATSQIKRSDKCRQNEADIASIFHPSWLLNPVTSIRVTQMTCRHGPRLLCLQSYPIAITVNKNSVTKQQLLHFILKLLQT